MISLYSSLKNYLPMTGDEITYVFFHTSCVLDKSLNELFYDDNLKKRYRFLLLNDSFFELLLLSYHSNIPEIKQSAQKLIANCDRVKNINLRDLYGSDSENNINLVNKLHIDEFSYIFAFYDGAAAEEFAENSVNHQMLQYANMHESIINNCRILYLNKEYFEFSPAEHMYFVPAELSLFCDNDKRYWLFRDKPQVLSQIRKNESITNKTICGKEKIYTVIFPGRKNIIVNGPELEVFNNGSFAGIFAVKKEEYSNIALKIFYNDSLSEDYEKLFKYYFQFLDYFKDNVSFPIALVYDNFRQCVGYAMHKFNDAEPFKNIYKPIEISSVKKYIKQLSVILLELRLFQLEMNDISENNFGICEDRIVMFDSDSLESSKYISSHKIFTPSYGHKDLFDDDLQFAINDDYYRDRRFNDFSYAVLLFRIYMSILPTIKDGIYHVENWKVMYEEGFDHYGLNSADRVSEEIETRWMTRFSAEQRSKFLDVFNFRVDFTIGQWIEALDL